MAELKNWHASLDIIKGAVYGHKNQQKCPDGLYIHTSAIKNISNAGEEIEVQTQNTLYVLKKSDISDDYYLCGAQNEKMQVLKDCLLKFSKDGESLYRELADTIAIKQKAVLDIAQKINPGEFFLALSSDCPYYFNRAFFKDADGGLEYISPFYHTGMFQDSVLLREDGPRYFPYKENNVEFYSPFYSLLDGAQNKEGGLLLNNGSMPLRVKFPWGKTIELKPGEATFADKNSLESYPNSQLTSQTDLYNVW